MALKLLESLAFDQYPTPTNSDYVYNGVVVPRVTAILSDMLHEESLMGWSNYLGLIQRKRHSDVLNEAAEKGTIVHDSIERYLQEGIELDFNSVPEVYKQEVQNAWNSFILWWNTITKNNTVEICMQEQPLVCEYFGGTLDILLKINGKYYLLDFKTSNRIGYKYVLQLAAYRYILYTKFGINVDGVGVIRLEKKEVNFEEFILNMSDATDLNIITHAEACFMSLVYGWYERKYIEKAFEERKKII